NDILMYMCFSKTPAFSPSGDCRPFSDRADGTIIGEGLGMFALRRLDDAERDGNHVYAVIRGLGSSSDGRATSVYAPRPDGQALALRRAYEEAGYSADTVELVEAHGTGTVAGDAAEFESLRSVFGAYNGEHRQWCALGSVKSQIGHTKAAAGAAGLFKVAMALHHKVLPPTIKVDRPNPEIRIDESPFYLNTQARPWIRNSTHPRRASLSSFGFGGSNFHLTIEEYTGPSNRPPRIRVAAIDLVLMSGNTSEDLAREMSELAKQAAASSDLTALARHCRARFDRSHVHRLAVIATSSADLADKLGRAADGIAVKGVHMGHGAPTDDKIAFLFPGQGSQYINMGAGLTMEFDDARTVWDRAADVTELANLPRVVFPPAAFDDDERERQTARLIEMANAQPAIAVTSLTQLALLKAAGLSPDFVAGHSFGEITALHAAGAIDEITTIRIARRRGEL
ncbi:MAG: acyltransferase domain-containing protein, partial [Pseudomonadota bacterium]